MLLKRRAQEIVSLSDKTSLELSRKDEIVTGEICNRRRREKSMLFLAEWMKEFQTEISALKHIGLEDQGAAGSMIPLLV